MAREKNAPGVKKAGGLCRRPLLIGEWLKDQPLQLSEPLPGSSTVADFSLPVSL